MICLFPFSAFPVPVPSLALTSGHLPWAPEGGCGASFAFSPGLPLSGEEGVAAGDTGWSPQGFRLPGPWESGGHLCDRRGPESRGPCPVLGIPGLTDPSLGVPRPLSRVELGVFALFLITLGD